MIAILLSLILGGYGGCGDCCGKSPRPSPCACQNCMAEATSESKPAIPQSDNSITFSSKEKTSDLMTKCQDAGCEISLHYKVQTNWPDSGDLAIIVGIDCTCPKKINWQIKT